MTLFKRVFLSFLICSQAYSFSKFSLDLGLDSRYFPSTETSVVEDRNITFNTNVSLKLKVQYLKILLEFYAQADPVDTNRTFAIPKDMWIAIDTGTHILKAGFQVINWSATEAFHPVDVLNSRFFDSNLQKPSKIGEPIVSYKYLFGDSSIQFMYLPYFTDPILATEGSAFGPGYDFDEIQIYETGTTFEDDNFIHQMAIQLSTSIGGTDLAFSYINHVDRDIPAFVFTGTKFIDNTTVPIFDAIFFHKQQFGLTSQSIIGDWIFKTEMAFVDWKQSNFDNALFTREDYFATALGLETTTAMGDGGEVTFIFEYQSLNGMDDILATNVFFQNDLLVGLRFSFNDLNSKELFLSAITDIEYGEQFFVNMNYSQRFFESWRIEMGLHYVEAEQVDNYAGLNFIDSSDHAYLNLKTYF